MENITLERLIIRKFKEEDCQDLFEYLSDKEVIKYEPHDVFTENQAKMEATRRADDKSFYAVCLKENDKLIGNLYFSQGDFDTWELGYVFNKQYQGYGYATESARGLIDYAFTELGARRIIAMCNPENEKSWKLLERLGMRREGTLLQNIYFKTDTEGNPIWLNTYEYAILSNEWSSLNK